MGRGRRGLVPAAASGPKERHKRSQRSQYHHPYSPPPETFKAKPSLPKSKHHSYFELVENKEKKKKLEYQITTEKTPPPGFEFVPIGNPQLTAACKEISREKDAMIFIVSNAKGLDESSLANQVHRVGHHIRQVIVEEAKESLGGSSHHAAPVTDAGPEPIPESQRAYHAQVDAAIRDLFPRIPNTDRQMIIEHSFTRGSGSRSEHPVGFSEDIALSRRVQLAVLAHIRHTHTRYDMLLKETTWQKARKTVESLCLDILVKWRGDEETGRDQLDEILREVVVISDSEDDEDDDDEEDSTDYTSDEGADNARLTPMPVYRSAPPLQPVDRTDRSPPKSLIREAIPVPSSPPIRIGLEDIGRGRGRRDDRRAQRGFRRYRAWEEAIRRNRGETPLAERTSPDMAISHASYRPSPPIRYSYDAYGRPYDNPDPMVHPGGVFGVSSHLDSHRMQRPVYGIPSSLNSSPYLSRTGEPQSSHEKVMSVVPFPTSTSSRELASSSASSHFQDMLVRSIESRSPTAQPTFIRTLPPRSQASVSSYAPLATSLASIQQPPKLVSHPGEEIRSWDRPPPAHVSTGFNRPQAMSIDAVSSRESVQSHDFRGSTYLHPPSGYGAHPAPPFSHPASSNPGSGSSRLPETRRIVLQATRPGERSNPIFMEDRGGYFERVNPRPESSSRIQLRPVRPAQQQTEVENRGIVRPHAILSWEEDLRNRGERRGVAEIEVNPIIDPRPHAPHLRQYDPLQYFGAVPPAKEEDYRVQSRRVPGGEYDAAPPEGYWTIRQHGDEQVSRPHHEPAVYHSTNILPPRADERYETRRDHRPLAQPAPNVIIID